MRCPNCSKFVSLELQDPEVNDLQLDDDGTITASVRVVRNCQDCGTEMKEATFDVSLEVPEVTHTVGADRDKCQLSVEDNLSQLEEGGGRYKKSYYGAEGTFNLTCTCGAKAEVQWSDKIDASSMDEIA